MTPASIPLHIEVTTYSVRAAVTPSSKQQHLEIGNLYYLSPFSGFTSRNNKIHSWGCILLKIYTCLTTRVGVLLAVYSTLVRQRERHSNNTNKTLHLQHMLLVPQPARHTCSLPHLHCFPATGGFIVYQLSFIIYQIISSKFEFIYSTLLVNRTSVINYLIFNI